MKNLALIGTGRWGQNYINEVEKIPGCQIKYKRGSDYLDLKTKYDIDGLIIASPATTHLDVIRKFPYLPILVEKPVLVDKYKLSEEYDIMAAHVYVYHSAIQKLKGLNIRYITFNLLNTERYNSDTSLLWELGPHPVSIAYYLFGIPDKIVVKDNGTEYLVGMASREIEFHPSISVALFYPHTTFHFRIGWNSSCKIRNLSVDGSNVLLNDYFPSPLRTQIEKFLGFIDGEKVETGMEHINAVTNLLKEIEQLL